MRKIPFVLSSRAQRGVSKHNGRSPFDTVRRFATNVLRANGFFASLCLCVSVVALLAACQQPTQMYEGTERPFSEISRICCRVAEVHGGVSGFIGGKLRIEAIDGRDAGYFETWVEIAPGRHEVRYAFLEGIGAYPFPVLPFATDRGRLVFNAQPGRGYVLKAERQGDTTWAWIEDEASRALVAGQRPPT